MLNKTKNILMCGLFVFCLALTGCKCFGEKEYDIEVKNISNIEMSVNNSQKAKKGEKITITHTLDNGYKLDYFIINGSKIDGNNFIMPNDDVEISASVSKIEYTITYHLDGETSFVNNNDVINTYTIGTVYNLPLVQKDAYDFKGWYTNQYFETEVQSITKEMYGNLDLYPRLENTIYNINYHYEGNVTNNNPATYTINSSTISLNNPVKDDFEFRGWYSNPTFSGEKVITIPSGSKGVINLYAKFVSTKVENGYRLITNEIDFIEIMSDEDNWNGSFKLTRDLDLTNIDALNLVIGRDANNAFTGVFDGNNKKISYSSEGTFTYDNKYLGLFNYIFNAAIVDLRYEFNINIVKREALVEGNSYVGGLVGFASGNTVISNCHTENSSITYQGYNIWSSIGGIVGSGGTVLNSSVKNVNFNIEVFTANVGGIAGENASLDNCKFENISTNRFEVKNIENNELEGLEIAVGGLVGKNSNNIDIINCHVDIRSIVDVRNSAVEGIVYLGGLVGISEESNTNTYIYLNVASLSADVNLDGGQKYVNNSVGFTKQNNV